MRAAKVKWRWVPGVLILSLTVAGGCISSDDGANRFRFCGNSVHDAGEECDDGNLLDVDDCLATCRLNQCGDEFLDSQGPDNIEQCDGRAINRTCASLGFQGGTLACTSECTFDTSACIPKPTPPGAGGAATSTTPPPPPTPTATELPI